MSEFINIRVSTNGTVWLLEEKGLTIKERQIDPEGLLELIRESVDNVVVDTYNSPPLPKNTVYYGVVERNGLHPKELVIIERDACIRPYNHLGEIYNAGYPKLLFCYGIKNLRINSSAVFAVVDEVISYNSSIYHFPYANTQREGYICMGSFHYPDLKNLSDLTYYPEAFYTIEHTHLNNSLEQPVLDLLRAVEEKPFDNDLLVFDCTFKQLTERLLGIRKN